jgi:hypothetical protein
MRVALIVVAFSAGSTAIACHRNQSNSPQIAATTANRSVFTDSALHVQRCEPTQPGENWRMVCVPKDQRRDDGVRPKKP